MKKQKSTTSTNSMAALLEKYSTTYRSFSRGSKIKGRVLKKYPKKLVLDIGGKSEGVVAEKAFEEARGFIDNLSEGDEVEAVVIVPETRDGVILLSLRHAAAAASWDKLIKQSQKGKSVSTYVRFVNPSGLMVEVGGLFGFIPNSQLSKKVIKDKDRVIGKNLSAIIIEVDKNSNRLILSEKAVSEGITPDLIKKARESVEEGKIYDGTITTVSDFGCFVEFYVKVDKKEIPLEGLVHVSELAWEKVQDTSSVVARGQKVRVKVIGSKNGKLALSMKQAQKDPWEKAESNYKVDKKIAGKVTKVTDFGVFVELEPGIEGLIHITKIPPDKKVHVGDEVKATIEEFDPKQRKISLALVLTQKPLLYK